MNTNIVLQKVKRSHSMLRTVSYVHWTKYNLFRAILITLTLPFKTKYTLYSPFLISRVLSTIFPPNTSIVLQKVKRSHSLSITVRKVHWAKYNLFITILLITLPFNSFSISPVISTIFFIYLFDVLINKYVHWKIFIINYKI